MPIVYPTIYEVRSSRPATVSADGTGDAAELHYQVLGTANELTVLTMVQAEIPAYYHGLAFQDFRYEPEGDGQKWNVFVRYGRKQAVEPATGADDDNSFSFDTSGGTQKLTQSLSTRSYAPTGETAPDFKGAIGVNGETVEGVDITVPALEFTLSRKIPAALVTLQYVAILYQMTGKVNSTSWKGFPAGELIFRGATGSKKGTEDPEVSYRFSGSQNKTNVAIGEIEGIEKKGWEYLWVRYKDSEDADELIKVPAFVYVEKVSEEADFSLLGIGS